MAIPVRTDGVVTPPEVWESGFKDIGNRPGHAREGPLRTGQFVWHCHIVEHEDNEMMAVPDRPRATRSAVTAFARA